MNTIECEFFQEDQLFDRVYTAEVRLINGSFPHKSGMIDTIQAKAGAEPFQLRSCYLEVDKDKNLYRLFYHVSTDCNHETMKTCEQTMGQNDFDHSLVRLQDMTNKVLLFIDESVLFENLAILYYLDLYRIEAHLFMNLDPSQEEKKRFLQKILPNHVNIVSSFSENDISPILQNQTIGTKLYLSGPWSMINKLKKIADPSGFTDEEMLLNGIGQKSEKVFCVKCYQINNRIVNYGREFVCDHCHSNLDVSGHYSKRLDAYLGYIKVV